MGSVPGKGSNLSPGILGDWRNAMEESASILLFEFTGAPGRCPEPLRVAFQAYLAGDLDRAVLQEACTAALGTWADRAPILLFRLHNRWSSRSPFDEMDRRILDCAIAVGPWQLVVLVGAFHRKHEHAIRDYLLAVSGDSPEMALSLILELYRWREASSDGAPLLWGQTLLTFLPTQGTRLLALIELPVWSSEAVMNLGRLLSGAGLPFRDLAASLAERLWAERERIKENQLPWLVQAAPERYAEWATHFLTPLSLDWPRSERQAALLEALMDVDPARYLVYAVQAAQLDHSSGTVSMPSLPGAGVTRAFQFDPARYLLLVAALLVSRREAVRCFGLNLLREHDWDGKLAAFIELLGHGRADVRASAVEWLAKQGNPALPALTRALAQGDARVRLHAATALGQMNLPAALDALRQRLPIERAPAVRQKLTALVSPPVVTETVSTASIEQIAALCAVAEAEPRAGRAFAWLDPTSLPPLHWCTGAPVPLAVLRYLLQCQASMGTMALAPVVQDALGLIEQASAGDFALALVNVWAASRASLADMRVLPLAAALGNDRLIAPLCARDDQRSEQVKAEVRCNEVWILSLLGTEAALRAIGARCEAARSDGILWTALDALAMRRQTTPEDLFDDCADDFGFSAQGEQLIVYNQRRLTVRINPAWLDEVRFFDEQGERLRSFPKLQPGENRQESVRAWRRWYDLSSHLRDRIEDQLRRLDTAITNRRCWEVSRWHRLFLEHPIGRLAASLLIWEYQAVPEAPWTRCTLAPDGECRTSSGLPLELASAGVFRLAHPHELETAELEQHRASHHWLLQHLWKEEGLGLQRWRPLTPMPVEERAAHWHEQSRLFAIPYHNLRENGWLPGSEIDNEPFITLWKPLPCAGVTILLQARTPMHFWRCWCRACHGELARLGFLPSGLVECESNASREWPLDDPRLLPLGEVPASVLSDALYDVQRFRKLEGLWAVAIHREI